MLQQDYKGSVRWVIVDDGFEETKIDYSGEIEIQYKRLPPLKNNTQGRNLLHAMESMDLEDKVVIIEDDDYYGPNWLKTISEKLDTFDLAGEGHSIYWNVSHRRFTECKNTGHASLCSTGLTRSAIPFFIQLCKSNKTAIDMNMWRQFRGSKEVFSSRHVIGIKGLPGRKGLGAGHTEKFLRVADPDGKNLFHWIGNDAETYLNICV
jgi:hypothetical protein